MANGHAFHASVTCFGKRKGGGGIEGSVWLATGLYPHHPRTPEHGTCQTATVILHLRSVSACFPSAMQRNIGVVLSPALREERAEGGLALYGGTAGQSLRRHKFLTWIWRPFNSASVLDPFFFFFFQPSRARFAEHLDRISNSKCPIGKLEGPRRSSTENPPAPQHVCSRTRNTCLFPLRILYTPTRQKKWNKIKLNQLKRISTGFSHAGGQVWIDSQMRWGNIE